MSYDYQMFKITFKGFDKDEVLGYIQKEEDDYNKQISDLQKEIKNRDKMIAELKSRIMQKDEQRERLENEITTKYQKYIDNYDKIGALVYESQMKGDKMVADAKVQADHILQDAQEKSDKILTDASEEANTKVQSVRGEVDAKLADGKLKYLAVQDAMNEIVELINEAQRKFMTSYKNVHEIVQHMPGSLREIDMEEAEKNEEEEDTGGSFETGELNFDTKALPLDGDEDEAEDTPIPSRGSNVEEISHMTDVVTERTKEDSDLEEGKH